MGRIVGIDLGTNNSCVGLVQGGVPEIIPNEEGTHTTPSVVGFTAEGHVLVGAVAKSQALIDVGDALRLYDEAWTAIQAA